MLKKHRWEELKREKKSVSKIFGGKCYICHRPWGKGFLFHHKGYLNQEKTYKDFPTQREYTEYILPIVRKNSNRFRCLCSKCHRAVEFGKRYNSDTYERLIKVVRESNYR